MNMHCGNTAFMFLLLMVFWTDTVISTLSGGPAPSRKYCSSANCQLPQCYCPGRRGPSNMQTHDIPQMVMLTFDDAVNKENMEFYRIILNGERLNPNGCPISSTFFVSHDWTDYKLVKELYLAGHEIADHSVSHRLPRNWWSTATYKDWEEELDGQRKNIANKASVPRFEVRGVRVPFLEVGGNTQFEVMSDKNFLYDSSFLTGPYNERDWRLPAWPFTLEYAPDLEYCDNGNCPSANFSGIWEVPLNRWLGLDGQACPMVDACTTQVLRDKTDTLRYLWKNFNRHYAENRAPFGLNLHATWLEEDFKLEALLEFIDGILELHDVYMVNIASIIEWMKRPTTLSAITKFEPWLQCGNRRLLVQRRKPTKTTVPKLKPTRTPVPLLKPTKMSDSKKKQMDSEEIPKRKLVRKVKKAEPEDDVQGNRDLSREGVVQKKILTSKKRDRGTRKSKQSLRTHSTEAPVESDDIGKNKENEVGDNVEKPETEKSTHTKKILPTKDTSSPKEKQNVRTRGTPKGRLGRAGTQTGNDKQQQSGSSAVVKSTLISMILSIFVAKVLSV